MRYLTHILCALTLIVSGSAFGGSIPLSNAGFELDTNGDGYPNGWGVGFGLIYDNGGGESNTGLAAIKANKPSRAIKDLTPPPLASLTLRAWIRADEAEGQQGDLSIQYYGGGVYLGVGQNRPALTTDYKRYGANVQLTPEADRILGIVSSSSPSTWVWIDDVDLLTDSIDNPSFEMLEDGQPVGWTAVGTPTVDESAGALPGSPVAVLCDDENYFSQSIAASPTTRTYVLQFKVLAETTPGLETIKIEWFDEYGKDIGKTPILTFIDSVWASYKFKFTPPDGAVWGEVSLRTTSEPVWFDDVRLSWQTLAPAWITPNADDINDVSTLYYLAPFDALTTISIVNNYSGVERYLVESESRPAGVYSDVFDGRDNGGEVLPDGPYRFLIEMQESDDVIWRMSNSIEIASGSAWLPQAQTVAEDFYVGQWEYVFGQEFHELSGFDDLINQSEEDNFNSVLELFLKEEDFDEAYESMEGSGVQAITHNYFINFLLDEFRFPGAFNERGVASLLTNYFSRYGGNSNWLGIYMKDEPPLYLANALRAGVRMTENLAPGLLPLSNFNVNTASEDLVALVLPSVLLFNSYPIDADVQLGSEQWEGYISDLERMEELSQQYERPFWHTAQGFFNSAARRPSIPAELRAIAGLTIGHSAKGIYYFIRSTFGGNEGLLNVDFENTEMMNQVALENERLTAFGPKLKELQSTDEIEVMTDDVDIFTRSFKDSSGNFFIIAVNKNTLIGKRPMLTVNGVEAGATSEEMLEVNGFPQFRPLPDRQDGQDLTIALSILPPGDWTIVSIKSD